MFDFKQSVRSALVNINSDETLFYPFTVSVNKCGGSCNTIDYPCARVFFQNMNLKVFHLMSRINKIRFLVQEESYECNCRLNKMHVIQSKNRIIMNFDVSVKN